MMMNSAAVDKFYSERAEYQQLLGSLLVGTGYVSPNHYSAACLEGEEMDMLPGSVLLAKRQVTIPVLDQVVVAASLVRSGKVSKETAVAALKKVRVRNIELEEAISTPKQPRPPRLGQLLSRCKLISEREAVLAAEHSVADSKPIGSLLVEANIISAESVSAAVKLQKLVERSVLTHEQACTVLRNVHQDDSTLAKVLSSTKILADDATDNAVVELLQIGGFICDDHKAAAMTHLREFEAGMCKRLIAGRMIAPHTYEVARGLCELVEKKVINQFQATQALQFASRNRASIEDTLSELGFGVKVSASGEIKKCQMFSFDTLIAKLKGEEGRALLLTAIVMSVALAIANTFIPEEFRAYTVILAGSVFGGFLFCSGSFIKGKREAEQERRARRAKEGRQTFDRLRALKKQ